MPPLVPKPKIDLGSRYIPNGDLFEIEMPENFQRNSLLPQVTSDPLSSESKPLDQLAI